MTKENREKLLSLFCRYGTKKLFQGVTALGSDDETTARKEASQIAEEFFKLIYSLDTKE